MPQRRGTRVCREISHISPGGGGGGGGWGGGGGGRGGYHTLRTARPTHAQRYRTARTQRLPPTSAIRRSLTTVCHTAHAVCPVALHDTGTRLAAEPAPAWCKSDWALSLRISTQAVPHPQARAALVAACPLVLTRPSAPPLPPCVSRQPEPPALPPTAPVLRRSPDRPEQPQSSSSGSHNSEQARPPQPRSRLPSHPGNALTS